MSIPRGRLTAETHRRFAGAASRITRPDEVIFGLGLLEGAVAGTVIGTHPSGPILARNPASADHVLELALGSELPRLAHPEIAQPGGKPGLFRVPSRQLGSGNL